MLICPNFTKKSLKSATLQKIDGINAKKGAGTKMLK